MIQGNAHLPPSRRRRRRWGAQRKTRDRLAFDIVAGALAAVLVSVWTASIVVAHRERNNGSGNGNGAAASVPAPVSRVVSASLTDPRAKSTAYLEDAVSGGYLGPLRGRSGKLQAVFRTPGEDLGAEEADPHFAGVVGGGGALDEQDIAPAKPGIYKLAIELGKARRPIADLKLVTLVPFAEKKKDRIGLYYLGSWPYEGGGQPRSQSYANPEGFIEVTRENKDTPRLRALHAGRVPDQGPVERLAEVPAARREAPGQAGAGHPGAEGARASTSTTSTS